MRIQQTMSFRRSREEQMDYPHQWGMYTVKAYQSLLRLTSCAGKTTLVH